MDSWDRYDEDGYPAGDDKELEYWEEWEEEDDPWEYQYAPVQGNWDPSEFEDDEYSFNGFRKAARSLHSMKTMKENYNREKKKQQRKIRSQAKAREKQRQKYYHYNNDKEDES